MTNKTARVLKGFIGLSPQEQTEFIQELNKYQQAGVPQRRLLSESIEKTAESIKLGPLGGTCGCCGK